ncbi:MAG: leucine-rich repeat domain-containing protein, partial [Sinobacterium sp.]
MRPFKSLSVVSLIIKLCFLGFLFPVNGMALSDTNIYFSFHSGPFPEHEPSFNLDPILISGEAELEYTVTIPPQNPLHAYQELHMFIVEQGSSVVIKDFVLTDDSRGTGGETSVASAIDMTGSWGDALIEGDTFTLPNGASAWDGFYNLNLDIYPLTFVNGGTFTFKASVPAGLKVDDGTWTYVLDGDSVKITGCSSTCLADLVIPNTLAGKSVTSIGAMAFSNNQLTSVSIPDGMTNIGYKAFSNNQLSSLTIPSNVTNIGHEAFTNNQLSSLTIPSNVTNIGYKAFYQNKLLSVIISNSMTSIGG